MVTFQLESGCHLQVDTGAQCNVLPLINTVQEVYQRQQCTRSLPKTTIYQVRITKGRSHITTYGGTTQPTVDTVAIRVY